MRISLVLFLSAATCLAQNPLTFENDLPAASFLNPNDSVRVIQDGVSKKIGYSWFQGQFAPFGTSGTGSGLPAQSGNAGEFLATDGTTASWTPLPGGGDMLRANNLSDVTSIFTARTNLGGTAVGQNFFTLPSPNAVRYVRINADNSVSTLDAASFLAAIGGGAGAGTWGSITGTLSNQTDLQLALDAKQGLNSNLTAISALTTTAHGRGLLDDADAAASRVSIGLNTLAAFSTSLGIGGVAGPTTFLRGDGTWAAPAAGGGGDMLAANNLSDLTNLATARTNLGVAIVATGFNGNLTTTDDTIQEVAQKFDDFVAGGGGSPPGSDTQVIFNDGGAFGADADLTWNKTTNTLTFTNMFTTSLTVATFKVLDNVNQSHGLSWVVNGDWTANKSLTYNGEFNLGITLTADSNITIPAGTVSIAPLGGPVFTGDPTGPTPTAGDNDTSLATTAFVNTASRGGNTGTHASPSTTNPLAVSFTSIMQAIWYGATGELDLPAAAGYAGRGFIVYSTGSFTITLDPNGSEVIVRNGTVQTGGVSMTLTAVAGNYVALISDGVRWITLGFSGTLAVGS